MHARTLSQILNGQPCSKLVYNTLLYKSGTHADTAAYVLSLRPTHDACTHQHTCSQLPLLCVKAWQQSKACQQPSIDEQRTIPS